MSTRAQINAIMPQAGEAVARETGVYATGFGITSKSGGLALAVKIEIWIQYHVGLLCITFG